MVRLLDCKSILDSIVRWWPGPTEWYRIVSSGFIHFGLLHIAFNMYLHYQLGGMLEVAIGRVRMLLLYIACLAGGSFGALLLQPDGLHGGASGAVFGLMGVTAMAYQHGNQSDANANGTLLLLNLAITFLVPGISIGGHLGGAATGAFCALVVTAPRQTSVRKERQPLLLVAIFLWQRLGALLSLVDQPTLTPVAELGSLLLCHTLVHTHGMSTTEPEHPLQLMLLPTSDLPECLRIDDATRITGLRHISELRAELEHRRIARNAAQPAA